MAGAAETRRRPLLGILTLVVGCLVAVSLATSPPWKGAGPLFGLPRESCGTVGLVASSMLQGQFGVPLALWGTGLLLVLGWRCLFRNPQRPWLFIFWSGSAALALSVLAGCLGGGERWGEGPLSLAGSLGSRRAAGPVGSALIAGGVFLVLLLLGISRWVPRRVLDGGSRAAAEGSSRGWTALRAFWARRREAVRQRREREAEAAAARKAAAAALAGSPPAGPVITSSAKGEPRQPSPWEAAAASLGKARPKAMSPEEEGGGVSPEERLEASDQGDPGAETGDGDPVSGRKAPAGEGGARRKRGPGGGGGERPEAPPAAHEGYVLPPVALLQPGEPPEPVNRDELLETSRTLVRTLKDFGIQGQVGQIHPGPVVTQYEYEPAAGVRVAQIVSRAEDLALTLRASRIRLVAPIPGKAAVGVEVPNRVPSTISLRSLLEELDLCSQPGELPMVLGRDIRGRPYAARLEQMPHLLVAGTTGSGKSVFLNCLLLSLLLRRTAEDLRLLLIDPKMLELTPYDDIPHLVCPVVTEAKVAARMLGWVVSEMERRYRRLASVGVRNLEGYRERVRSPRGEAEGLEKMPHIVVFVDELADLMLTLANEIEGPIARLAQMARAVGIHLVLATQRPSVDVITGVIKANFPARIAFQVASKVDSRTILDANGAESLLGRGDMLFLPPGKAEAVRVHGPFVSDKDTEAVVGFLRAQPPSAPLVPVDSLLREESDSEPDDELFEDALRLVILQKQASTSFLQRRLKVGYSRAGRLMDLLESAGAVGPQDGSKAREVLADERFLDAWRTREGRDETHAVGR